jgi:hypothetical protein
MILMDSSRELRAMAMVAFPCPPLPVIGMNRDNEPIVINSHDMLAFLMNTAALRNIPSENTARLERQKALQREYAATCKSRDAWGAMTNFTRLYMMSYCPAALDQVRFLPFDALTPPLRTQVRSWLAARCILMEQEAKAEDFESLHDHVLYKKCLEMGMHPI